MEIDRTSKEQSFYIGVILYESSSSASEYKPLYEECFVFIKATSLEEANEKALIYAREQEGSCQNEYNDTITWSLKQVVDVNSVLYDEFDDGTELYLGISVIMRHTAYLSHFYQMKNSRHC